MTLIYARKLDDVIYCFADTASSNQMLQTYSHPIEEPFIKIISLSEDLALAFAGDVKFVSQVRFSVSEPTREELVASCLDAATASGGNVEFLVLDRRSWSLTSVTSEGAEDCLAKSLGTREARERLAAERLEPTVAQLTYFAGVFLPDKCSPESQTKYQKDFLAFQSVLDQNHPDFRGVLTPYALTQLDSGFLSYFRLTRGPIEPGELVDGTWTRITFGDGSHGQSSFVFCGGQGWLAYHVGEAAFGVFATSSTNSRDVKAYTQIRRDQFVELGTELMGQPLPFVRLG